MTRKNNSVPVALVVADVHLSHEPPRARAAEPDWYEAMRRVLFQLDTYRRQYKVPIIYAGDIFDHWNPPVELVNFALQHLPKGYAIMGQHDLPYHDYKSKIRSAFWTLLKTNHLILLEEHPTFWCKDFAFYGRGWEEEIREPSTSDHQNILILHKYLWSKPENSYKKAPESAHVKNLPKEALKYDVIFSGDNHIRFGTFVGKTYIYNCGSLMRRTVLQRGYCPVVHALYSDGHVEIEPISTSNDKWTDFEDDPKNQQEERDFTKAIQSFKKMGVAAADFVGELRMLLNSAEISAGVKKILKEGLNEIQDKK
jgi:hypothetical protein